MPSKIKRNLSTPEARAFWESAEANAAEVRSWPAWKRAGINVRQGGIPHDTDCTSSVCLGECLATDC